MTLSSKENKLLCGHREGLQPWHSLHYSVCKTIYAVAKLKLQLLAKKKAGWLVDVLVDVDVPFERQRKPEKHMATSGIFHFVKTCHDFQKLIHLK